jgi:EAL domain-containing protein (putative c-di-GMP-specific phosphodiesterase class I)
MKRFPIDELKVDRPFVKGLTTDAGDRAVVSAAIDIGHRFGMRVVAEGVEDGETVEELARLGCDLAQGNFFGAPIPAAAMREWWATRDR